MKKLLALLACLTLLLVGCDEEAKPTDPSPTPSTELLTPGAAQKVVGELLGQIADPSSVVRLRITGDQARLTYVDEWSKPVSEIWRDGKITTQDEGTDTVVSSSFDPRDFNISDVGAMFEKSAQLCGSAENQELQITEYANSKILMTVSTTPESSTVFFRPDATVIMPLDFTSAEDVSQALTEAVGPSTRILAAGLTADQLWVDVASGPGTVTRRIRKTSVPVYSLQRKQSISDEPFAPSLIDAKILAEKFAAAAESESKDFVATVKQQKDEDQPFINFSYGGTQELTSLDGTPVKPR
ncbi:hypothetical protein [Propionimicrobium sp. BV2F7]|uniref:hypothetical protein n=1 Tax=Propionimicrobium sp. BV2F7 TaxID=1111131 RepID=UPI0003D79B67|nr:hypothetical protein [Propionimicrobium sp. BV2F7]ETJ98624.1 hypothetical protein HMPREF1255_0186 [Propionimicrobium sp. BV2F7]